MTARPILFSGPMVRALLAGRKTQTRRIIDFPGIAKVVDFVRVAFDRDSGVPIYEMKDAAAQFLTRPKGKHFVDHHYSPRYAVGDRLWVREAWTSLADNPHCDLARSNPIGIAYRATDDDEMTIPPKWRPGIHMPRRASRLTLAVTDVRLQRLHQISEEDAKAEGVQPIEEPNERRWHHYVPHGVAYRDLWNSLNRDRGFGWESNPWVVAVTFTVERRNIDEVA